MRRRAGSLWHKRAGASNSSDLTSTWRWRTLPGTAVAPDLHCPVSEDALVLFTHITVAAFLQALASPVPAPGLAVAIPVGLGLNIHRVVLGQRQRAGQEEEENDGYHRPGYHVSQEGHQSYQTEKILIHNFYIGISQRAVTGLFF